MERESISLLKCPVVVITDTVHNIDVCSRDAGYGAVPTIANPTVHVTSIEMLKVQIHLEQVLP
jgi:hypothetical protein